MNVLDPIFNLPMGGGGGKDALPLTPHLPLHIQRSTQVSHKDLLTLINQTLSPSLLRLTNVSVKARGRNTN